MKPSTAAQRLLFPVVVFVAACAVYAGIFGHTFIFNWDDGVYVTGNEAARGLSAEHLKLAFGRFYVGNYAPLQIASYMLDYTLWGGGAKGYLATNVLLHALNGVLLYFLVSRVSRQRFAAVVAAVLFVAHPVQVESVAWISQRKNVLALLFFLLSLYGYVAYREREPGKGRSWYVASVAFFLMALLTKAVAVVLPLALLLFDLCYPREERRRAGLVDKVPYLLAAAGLALLTIRSQSAGFLGGGPGYPGGSPLTTVFTMLPVAVRYLKMLVWPAGLSALYLPPVKTGVDAEVALAALLLALLGCLGGYLFMKRRELFFWFALFFVGLLPVSQLMPLPTLMNDRYLYFPMIGAAPLYGLAVAAACRGAPGGYRLALGVLFCIPLLIHSGISRKRSEVWQDAVTLWSDTVKKTPESSNAWIWLVEAYYRSGRLATVPPAQLQDPAFRQALNDIVDMYLARGQVSQARAFLRELLRAYPGIAGSYLGRRAKDLAVAPGE